MRTLYSSMMRNWCVGTPATSPPGPTSLAMMPASRTCICTTLPTMPSALPMICSNVASGISLISFSRGLTVRTTLLPKSTSMYSPRRASALTVTPSLFRRRPRALRSMSMRICCPVHETVPVVWSPSSSVLVNM